MTASWCPGHNFLRDSCGWSLLVTCCYLLNFLVWSRSWGRRHHKSHCWGHAENTDAPAHVRTSFLDHDLTCCLSLGPWIQDSHLRNPGHRFFHFHLREVCMSRDSKFAITSSLAKSPMVDHADYHHIVTSHFRLNMCKITPMMRFPVSVLYYAPVYRTQQIPTSNLSGLPCPFPPCGLCRPSSQTSGWIVMIIVYKIPHDFQNRVWLGYVDFFFS